MLFFITLLLVITAAILGWLSSMRTAIDGVNRLNVMPLSELRKKLGIREHVTTVIVNGKPIHFDYSGKEIK